MPTPMPRLIDTALMLAGLALLPACGNSSGSAGSGPGGSTQSHSGTLKPGETGSHDLTIEEISPAN